MRTGPQSLSQQQKGPTPAQMKLMGDLDLYLEVPLEFEMKKLDFEIDGASHKHRQAKDEERDGYLFSIGIKPVHIPNKMVMEYGDVIASIVGALL